MQPGFKKGTYKHFKGGLYEALFLAKNSENPKEDLVVYKSLENGQVWVRPAKMFFEEVKREEYEGPRFALVGEK